MEEIASGAEIIDAAGEKRVGALGVVMGSQGMGLLRVDEALKGPSLTIKGHEGVKVNVFRPAWWPSEWGQEA